MKDPLGDAPPVETRRAVIGALVTITALVGLCLLRPSVTITVLIAVGIVFTVMLHEAGHLIGAKRGGMKATEFFVGFGPRLWSFRRGETEYGLKAIPAGGYVRVIGMTNLEEVDEADEPRTYRRAPYGRKMVMILAGVTVNLVLAYLLTFTVLVGRGQDEVTTRVGAVVRPSPAYDAGLRPGDRLAAIEGTRIDSWAQVAPIIQPAVGRSLRIVVVGPDGQRRTISVTPETMSGVGRIGVSAAVDTVPVAPLPALGRSVTVLGTGMRQTVGALAHLFSPAGVEQYGRTVADPGSKGALSEQERPRSVIGIVAEGGDLVGGDLWGVLGLLAAVNLFLALFNLIPLLPFDGGHAIVATYEAAASRVRGRRVVVDQRRLMPVTAVVIGLLLLLGLSTMYLDVRGLVTGG
ncbi:MAG: M50 family metallopeptidase [Actinomycetes bacterium]